MGEIRIPTTVLLFGAGASVADPHILPEPPLGKYLFCELQRLYPHSWGDLPRDDRTRLLSSFEDGMAALQQRRPLNFISLLQDMARFFLRVHVDGTGQDRYSQLLRAVQDCGALDRTLFSTLNYECALDQAVRGLGYEVSYWNDDEPPVLPAVPVWKLHGSCNFTADRDNRGWPTAVREDVALKWLDEDPSHYPGMSLYARYKPIPLHYNALPLLSRTWVNIVKCVEGLNIFVIGVRPNDEDQHIWDPLAETAADVYYGGGREDWDAWVARRRPGRPSHYLGPSFERALGEIISSIN